VDSAPTLRRAREIALAHALNRSFRGGRLQVEGRDQRNFFAVLHPEVLFACLAAREYRDENGPFAWDVRARDAALAALEGVAAEFRPSGVVGAGDMNTPYFTLVPATRALLDLCGHVDEARHARLVERCARLYADAAANIPRLHDYLNPRAMEAVGALGLARLTGEEPYRQRCLECLDELLKRQYPCGAQPYHTGGWIWGRKPAQAYQYLTASLMLYLGRELGREDAVQYVRRLMDYSRFATNRRGEAFVTTFEGLHKARTLGCAGRQWPIAAALGEARFRPLARATYELWARTALDMERETVAPGAETSSLVALVDALHLGVEEVPSAPPFLPEPGRHLFHDISAAMVHEPGLDLCMSLLSGYSAFAEADCGDVKLFALTPELTDEPTFKNAGTDAARVDWRVPSEQLECTKVDGRIRLRGRVYTKWDGEPAETGDTGCLHNRLLDVTMEYAQGELVLTYETIRNTQRGPVPSRLLLLLIARPPQEAPVLALPGKGELRPPPAASGQTFRVEAGVGPVRFSARDGSRIEVVPERSMADRIVAERPPPKAIPRAEGEPFKTIAVRPANEGSLRLCFEGPDVLDEGRYRVRFLPGPLQQAPASVEGQPTES